MWKKGWQAERNSAIIRAQQAERNSSQTEYTAGGRKDMDERLTAKELDRLADWLTAQGLTPEKVLECIKYIAGESAPAKG